MLPGSCHCVWTDVEQDGEEQRHHVEKGKKGTLNGASRCERTTAPLRDNSPSWTTWTTSYKSPCSATRVRQLHTSRPVQRDHHSPYKTNQSHSSNLQHRQLRQPSRCTNSISTTTSTTTFHETATHMRISTHFTQSQ